MVQTIRLSPQEKKRLAQHIDQTQHQQVDADRRGLRVAFHVSDVVVVVIHPNGTEAHHAVQPRNLSRYGMSFAIGRYIYPDSVAMVFLPTVDGKTFSVGGRIVRCQHFEGMIHDCGVVFESAVDLSLFTTLTDEQAACLKHEFEREITGDTGTEPPAKLIALIVSDEDSDGRLFGLWLEKLGFQFIKADSSTQARQVAASEKIELILINQTSSQETELELVRWLRINRYRGPIVVATDNTGINYRNEALAEGVNDVLVKPFDLVGLQQIIEGLVTCPRPPST